ncbi:saccharopine dehydrogenase NADP-binding domain-containing protein [Flavobacterium sp. Fl-318]|uniref:Saccharopine dehydrogenase NADP-binding domain-containing protein n=1 Tax=Flavobacterium cupriresistens TaxID=2893885 RepID=A0ABU4RCW2_9FLAO|nr:MULTISPECIES: saccharopine dehydrogenase NADP-binding domain-containing protein [unclassified Flavobacterium]MDX6189703.1 saccharopine dehydrogenase NADP-binding domain-containing protein [Flavobacterium sp. Fl-318]UFH40891.1 saccharopine dehydrogenase NADP-binding domain-containing protein [Flavobacterium sp. F-323]
MIGIIGGYGEVGHHACLTLQQYGIGPLKIGGRNPEKGKAKQSDFLPGTVWEKVDVENDQSLSDFIVGCDLILNCAAPSHRYSRRIAKICLQHKVNMVDAGIDNNYESNPLDTGENVIVYAAGATPGFSGLFPVWFAQQFQKVHSLLSYYGTSGQITPAGAEDYLEGSLHSNNVPRAAWRNGVVPNVLSRKSGVKLPFFPGEITLFPLFDDETQLVAKRLALENGEWYAAVEGEKSIAALDSASFEYKTNPKAMIEKLCFAVEMDTLGRSPYFILMVQLKGESEGLEKTQTAVYEVSKIIPFCGKMAAIIVKAVLEGKISPGLHHTASIEDVNFVMNHLEKTDATHTIQIIDHSIEELSFEEEGTL